MLRLQQQSNQADGAQRAIGKLMGSKYLVRCNLPPVQNGFRGAAADGGQIKISKEWSDQANRCDDPSVSRSAIFIAKPKQKCCQIGCIWQQRAIVADIARLANTRGGRR